jgi:hypothetical protein
MKKHLDATSIVNELRGQSAFFPQEKEDTKQEIVTSFIPSKQREVTIPRYHNIMRPSNHDTTTPFPEDELLEEVRKAVKQVGKEAATQRLTLGEKQLLADIEYGYKRQGIRTSGNEIMRIATNYIIRDYRKNGETSVLAKIIKQLNS